RCDAAGCRQPLRLQPGSRPPPVEPAPLTLASLSRARGWLNAAPPQREQPARGDGASSLLLWAVAGVAAVAAAATAAVALTPESEQRLRVEIGPAADR
ncbi:MAG: hypothetical protein PVI30_26190, partial [Myxococcales bacterium]